MAQECPCPPRGCTRCRRRGQKSKWRRALQVDPNQAEIVAALRKVGATVQTLAAVGQGCPDLMVGFRRQTYLLEVKSRPVVGSTSYRPSSDGCKLNEKQTEWHLKWRGMPVAVVHDVDEALAAICVDLAT